MTTRYLLPIALLSVGLAAFAVGQEAPSKLPIDVPAKASVNFEADASGKEFMPINKQFLLENEDSGYSDGGMKVKTPLGEIKLTTDEIKPLVENIHEMHIVTYKDVDGDDPFKRQEKLFLAAGMHRLTFVPGSNGVLILRKSGKTDEYGIVVRSKGVVTILRTSGGPNLGDLEQVVLKSITQLAQSATKTKKKD